MAVDKRHANVRWSLPTNEETGAIKSWEAVKLAVLLDIRDELQRLNALLHCANFQGIPRTLKGIQRKLPTPAPRRKGTP